MDYRKPPPAGDNLRGGSSRRQALALALGCRQWFPAALEAAVPVPPIRLAISESLVADVNLNDARAAMTIWLQRMMVDLNVVLEFSPKVFDTTEEIVRRARIGDFDCVALNVVEYRQIAEFLDSSQIIAPQGANGIGRYLLLAKRDNGIQRLADLKGRTLLVLKHPQMCVAGAWISSILEEGHLSQSDQFFGSVTEDANVPRVVLPVFFGRTDACLTTSRSFDTMCELNPQVGKTLTAIAISPAMVMTFYVFRKDYHGAGRDSFVKVYSSVSASASGRQLATLFQFDSLVVRDATCLAPAQAILERAARVRSGLHPGGRKG
jgi:phosphonate transport system substrate-binding protein